MRVATIELFFDLVFVFTVTQITHLVAHGHGVWELGRAFLVLMLVWWMFAGYAWLTNSTRPGHFLRFTMIAAMTGFLVMALAVPGVFAADGLVFALAYLFVVVLHLAAFVVTGGRPALRGVLELAPFNLGAALLVLAAGIVDVAWEWVFFAAAALLYVIATMLHRERRFTLRPDHFAERHGLIILVALGETIVAIGGGAQEHALSLHTAVAVLLSLLLIATLWWSYFDHDDVRAEHALTATPPEHRSRAGVLGYWYGHLVMLAGIVLIAAALKEVVALGAEAPAWSAWVLACGLSAYLAGDVLFRWVLRLRPLVYRALAAMIALPLGFAGGGAELTTLAALMIFVLATEHVVAARAPARA